MRRSAFTLIEIMIAVSIIAVLVAAPILFFSRVQADSRNEQRRADIGRIQQALEDYKAQNGVYPDDLQDLVTEGYLAELPVDPLDGEPVEGMDGLLYGYERNYNAELSGQSYKLTVPLEETDGAGGEGALEDASLQGTAGPSVPGGAVNGLAEVNGTITGGVFTGTFVLTTPDGSITGSVNGAVTGGTDGSVSGTCTVTGTVTGPPPNNFSGTIANCALEPVESEPIIIVDPEGPKEIDDPAILSQAPEDPLPTVTDIPTPTTYQGVSPTPLPQCDQTIQCSACQTISGRCGTYQSTQTNCQYSAYSGGGPCTPVSVANQNCTISGGTCAANFTCSATNCLSPTPTFTPTPTPSNTPTLTPTNTPAVTSTPAPSYQFKRYAGDSRTNASAIAATGGRYYLSGFYENSGTPYLYQLGTTGNVDWARTVTGGTGTTLYYYSSLGSVSSAPGVNPGVIGVSRGQQGSNFDMLIFSKFRDNGNHEWSRGYRHTGGNIEGTVKQTSDGNYIYAGGGRAGTNYEFYMAKLNSTGTMVWQQTFGSVSGFDFLSDVVEDPSDNSYIAIGTSEESMTVGKVVFVKISSGGAIQWVKSITVPLQGASSINVSSAGITKVNDGFVGVATITRNSLNRTTFIAKITSGGAQSWVRETAIPYAVDVVQTVDSTYGDAVTVVGNNNDHSRGLMVKLTSAGGGFITGREIGTTGANDYEYITDLAEEPTGFSITGRQYNNECYEVYGGDYYCYNMNATLYHFADSLGTAACTSRYRTVNITVSIPSTSIVNFTYGSSSNASALTVSPAVSSQTVTPNASCSSS